MNRFEYLRYHGDLCEKMCQITKQKNSDYSREDDPFANFKVVEAYGLSVEQGFITRMSDKMSRLSNIVRTGEIHVKSESVEDTLLDLANYCLLMAGYLKSKAQSEKV